MCSTFIVASLVYSLGRPNPDSNYKRKDAPVAMDFDAPEDLRITMSGDHFPDFQDEMKEDPPGVVRLKTAQFTFGTAAYLIHPESFVPAGKVVGRIEFQNKSYLVTWHRGSILIQSEKTGLTARLSIPMALVSLLVQGSLSEDVPDIDDPDNLGLDTE